MSLSYPISRPATELHYNITTLDGVLYLSWLYVRWDTVLYFCARYCEGTKKLSTLSYCPNALLLIATQQCLCLTWVQNISEGHGNLERAGSFCFELDDQCCTQSNLQ